MRNTRNKKFMKYSLCVKLCQHNFTTVIVHKLLVHDHCSESGMHNLEALDVHGTFHHFIITTFSDYQSLRPSIKKHSQDESPRNSSRRSVSEDREDSVLSDSFSMLSMSNSNIPHHLTNRMSQYSPQ